MTRAHAPVLSLALLGLLLSAGCAGTGNESGPADTDVVSEPPPPPTDVTGASTSTAGAETGFTTESEPGEASTTGPADEEATSTKPTPESVAPTLFGPEGDYFPGPLSTVRFAGLRYLDEKATTSIQIVQTSAEKQGDRVPFAQTFTEGDRALEERFVAQVTPEGLHVGLADGRLRLVPAPVREMPRRPRLGESWSVALGGNAAVCLVESLDTAKTFVGDIEGCVRVRIDHPGGAVHLRWYHPQRGLVRAEARDAQGGLLSGWALSNETWPTMDQVRRVFPRNG